MDEITKKLNEEIEVQIENLRDLTPGSDEQGQAVEAVTKLYRLRIDEMKMDQESEETKKNRFVKIVVDGAELVIPLIAYGIWMRLGLRFEETGTFTSVTFKNLFQRFRPR